MAKRVEHPNRLRTLLKEAGLTIREVHRETTIPESTLYYWAAGYGVIPKDDRIALAHVIGCSPSDLAPNYDMLKLLSESNMSASEREMMIKRRELLHLLSIASGALFISDVDWDLLKTSLAKPSYIDITLVDNLETINNHCWSLFLAASPKSIVLDVVLGQLKMCVQFIKEVQAKQLHQRLCTLASSISQLAGEILFDLHDHSTAQSCYSFAVLSAKEARAYDLWASALVRYSYLPIFDERYEEALLLLKQAEQIALQGDLALSTRYWAAATYAEAGVGNLKACQRALERANGTCDLTGISPTWIRFDESRLPALKGVCYVRMKQPHLAEPILQEALQQSAKTNRRRALIVSDLALTALQQMDLEKACTYGEELVTLTSNSASGFLRNSVLKLEQHLAPYAEVESVRVLENHIASLE